MSPAVHKEMRPVAHASAAICKPGTGLKRAASEAYPLDKLTDPGPAAEAEAETQGEIAMGAVVIGEETIFLDEVPTAAEGGERYRDEECEVDERSSADESAIGDETISDAQIFEDAASHQS